MADTQPELLARLLRAHLDAGSRIPANEALVLGDPAQLTGVLLDHGTDEDRTTVVVFLDFTGHAPRVVGLHLAPALTTSRDLAAADVRALPLGDLFSKARLALSRARDQGADRVSIAAQRHGAAAALTADESELLAPWRRDARGQGTRPDDEYAVLAMVYLALLARGVTTPSKAIAAELGTSAQVITDRITKARSRGLLTNDATQGRPGGELTAKGKLLAGDRVADTVGLFGSILNSGLE
ncbi:MAG: Rrf2 family transcriptional regulator [Cellulomonas sp.]|nr:Rrf2 family transcriptional regulator [Cellulomonas sp.]